MPQLLDYHSEVGAPRKTFMTPAAVASGVVAGLVILANAILLTIVIRDNPNGQFGGWADVFVLLGLAPLSNGLLLVIGLACAPLIKRASGGRPIMKYVLVSILLPIAGYAVDYALISGGLAR